MLLFQGSSVCRGSFFFFLNIQKIPPHITLSTAIRTTCNTCVFIIKKETNGNDNGKVERSRQEDQKRFYSCHAFYSPIDFSCFCGKELLKIN